jgi:diguanylate cyclase (GGDEF)-like protein
MGGPDILAIVETDGTVRASGGATGGPLGEVGGLLPGQNILASVHPDDTPHAADFLATVARSGDGDATRGPVGWRLGYPANGRAASWRHVEATAANRLEDPEVRGIVISLRDVDDRAGLEAQLRHNAVHDALTGLPNRSLFYDRVEMALGHEGRTVALMYLDLDGFKGLNDRLGHQCGDEILVEVARRLSTTLRTGDTAARLGGDEFGILLEGVSGENDAVQAADRVLAAFREPVRVAGCDDPIDLQPSAGVAVAVSRGIGADELLRRADTALFEAKRQTRRPWVLYDPRQDSGGAVRRRRSRGPGGWFARTREQRDEVSAVLDRKDALVSAYQPIIDLRTGLVAGYEALARFPRNPGRSPIDWFAQAHRSGLGFALEALAVRAALAGKRRPTRTFLTINLSPSALSSPEVQAALPERLDGIVIEITENEHVPDDRAFWEMRESLRERGGRLAIDDAGSGYAGLRQLMRLQPDLLKLDRSMVDGIHRDGAKAALVEAMVRYAREIGAEVCAEGIETLADLEALADLDVTFGQGWAIARPARIWPNVTPDAAAACRASYSANLRRASSEEVSHLAHDRRLEWLTWKLNEASGYAELSETLQAIGSELHADDMALSVIDAAGDDLVFVGSRGLNFQEERFRIAEFPTTEWLLREQATLQILAGDPTADPSEVRLLSRLGMQSVLMLPVLCGGRSIGLLEAYSRVERPWSRFEIGRARIIAFQVGAALERLSR